MVHSKANGAQQWLAECLIIPDTCLGLGRAGGLWVTPLQVIVGAGLQQHLLQTTPYHHILLLTTNCLVSFPGCCLPRRNNPVAFQTRSFILLFMITSRFVRPLLSTGAAFASLLRPVNTPQIHSHGSVGLFGAGTATASPQLQLLRKMHIQSIPMCMSSRLPATPSTAAKERGTERRRLLGG